MRVAVENTTCGPKIAGVPTMAYTKASEVWPLTAFVTISAISVREKPEHLLSAIMRRALTSRTPASVPGLPKSHSLHTF